LRSSHQAWSRVRFCKRLLCKQLTKSGGRGTRTPKRLPAAVFKFGLLPLQIIVARRIPEVKSAESQAARHCGMALFCKALDADLPTDLPKQYGSEESSIEEMMARLANSVA
jgi:hypothetical protein